MSKDKLAFLDDSEPEPEAEAVEAVEAAPEPEAEPEAPEHTGEKQADAGPPPASQEDKHVPLASLLDERDKRKAIESELAEMRKWREEQERKAREAERNAPDPYEDPKGWAAHQQQEVRSMLFNERLNVTEQLARQQYGDETVAEAQRSFLEASQRDPTLGQRLVNEPNPYGFVMQWHKRQKFMSEIGDDPEKWREAERERIRQELMQEVTQQRRPTTPQPAPSAPAAPRSLAGAPNAGTGASRPARGPGTVFDEIFGG